MKSRSFLAAGAAFLFGFAAQAKDYTGDIQDGAIAFGEITEDSTLTIASGVEVSCSTAITGTGKLTVDGGGTLTLKVASPAFSGGFYVKKATLKLDANGAGMLGTGLVTVQGATNAGGVSQLYFTTNASGATLDNDIVYESATKTDQLAMYFQDLTSAITFSDKGSVNANGSLYFYSPCTGGQTYQGGTFNGPVVVKGTIAIYVGTKSGTCSLNFYGTVTADTVFSPGDPNTVYTRIYLYNSNNRIGTVRQAYKGYVYPMAVGAWGGGALSVSGNNRGNFDMKGYDQTCAYVTVSATKQDRGSVTSSSAATLTLTGGVASASCNGWIGLSGKLSLVVDDHGEEGNYTQTFAGETATVMSMSGSIDVKRGNLRFTGEYALKNVPSVRVTGGSFMMDTTAEASLGGLTNLVVEGTGAFTLGANATAAFPVDSSMDISISSTATLDFGPLTDVYARYFFIDGKGKRIADYTHAECTAIPEGVTIHVANAPQETTEPISWTGGGQSDSIIDPANWGMAGDPMDFSGDKYLLTLAPEVVQKRTATLAADASFHGIVFEGPDFAVLGHSVLGLYSDGIAFTDGALEAHDAHTYTIEPPVSFMTAATIIVPDKDVLVLSNGFYAAESVEFGGEGTNMIFGGGCDFHDTVTISGKQTCFSGVIGDPESSDGSITLSMNAGNAGGTPFLFRNATINKPVSVACNGENGRLHFGAETNIFTKSVYTGSKSCTWFLFSDSVTIFEGGVSGNVKTWFSGTGTAIIRKTPSGSLGTSEGNPFATSSGGSTLILQVAGNAIRWIKPSHSITIRTEADYALNGETGAELFAAIATTAFDLTSTRQIVKTFTSPAKAKIMGEYGGVLEVRPAADAVNVIGGTFEGGVSLCVNAAADSGTQQLSAVSTSCGDLEVQCGTLELAANATWLNGTNFTAKGEGTLKFAARGQVDKNIAQLYLEDKGLIEIPAGVTLHFASADINGVSVKTGIYTGKDTPNATSSDIADRIVGGGTLKVGKLGLVLVVE